MKNDTPSESGHWYHKDGTPCYEIEYSDKKRKGEFRPTTLRDAKKLDLVPSVTTITKILNKPQLNEWFKKQILESAYTCPLSRKDVTAEEWMKRVKDDAEEQAKVARDKGTEIHGDVEKFITGIGEWNLDNLHRCKGVVKALVMYDILPDDIEAEKSFATQYYGGKIDLLSFHDNFVADIKTTEFTLVDGVPHKKGKKAKLQYDDHILQLSGYGDGAGLLNPRAVNIFVSTLDDSVYCHEWLNEDYQKALRKFNKIVDLWWTTNF